MYPFDTHLLCPRARYLFVEKRKKQCIIKICETNYKGARGTMKKFARLISLLLVLMVVAVFLPTISTAAVSVPSNVKSVVFNAEYYAKKYSDL